MTKTLTLAVVTAILLAAGAPAFAADQSPPTTKSACRKMTDMKWDSKTHTCVHK